MMENKPQKIIAVKTDWLSKQTFNQIYHFVQTCPGPIFLFLVILTSLHIKSLKKYSFLKA